MSAEPSGKRRKQSLKAPRPSRLSGAPNGSGAVTAYPYPSGSEGNRKHKRPHFNGKDGSRKEICCGCKDSRRITVRAAATGRPGGGSETRRPSPAAALRSVKNALERPTEQGSATPSRERDKAPSRRAGRAGRGSRGMGSLGRYYRHGQGVRRNAQRNAGNRVEPQFPPPPGIFRIREIRSEIPAPAPKPVVK